MSDETEFHWKVTFVELLGGWLVWKSRDGRYWYPPDEEVTYGVLDSQRSSTYTSREDAERRVLELGGSLNLGERR
jgi:hypothetical protein